MFERYTEPARRALFFARVETTQLGAGAIETEHILLGLMRDPGRVLSRVLGAAQLSPETIRQAILNRSATRETISASVEIPFTEQTKRALLAAAEEADLLQHRHIGSEHLLLGLLRVEGSVAASVLAAHGLGLDAARKAIAETPPSESDALPAASSSMGASIFADVSERLDQIQRLAQQLHRRFSDDKEAHVLFERIDEELNTLRRRFSG